MIGADMRESLRECLSQLPATARRVYNRDNISAATTPLLTVVETVLYHFDVSNRARVATLLGMTDRELMILLVGYVIGHGAAPRSFPGLGE